MNLDDTQSFGKAVRAYRKRQKISQTQIAAVANTGTRFISDLENGKPSVQLDKALKVAWLLGIRFEVADPEVPYPEIPYPEIPDLGIPEPAAPDKSAKKKGNKK
ncbi:MAG: helix-turn-helix transcriptional regulator [Treponema sp.]|nr:helix-turn-helix transcriptional regulator [Treponema sp.]